MQPGVRRADLGSSAVVPAQRRHHRGGNDEVHDILAAEEFAVGSADPALHDERPHDVLAAEEFAVGSADLSGHSGAAGDPSGIERPHDVLAAEEFAVPAPARPSEPHALVATVAEPEPDSGHGGPSAARLLAGAAVAGAVSFVLTRRLRGRRG
jgi:hypothetical protein